MDHLLNVNAPTCKEYIENIMKKSSEYLRLKPTAQKQANIWLRFGYEKFKTAMAKFRQLAFFKDIESYLLTSNDKLDEKTLQLSQKFANEWNDIATALKTYGLCKTVELI